MLHGPPLARFHDCLPSSGSPHHTSPDYLPRIFEHLALLHASRAGGPPGIGLNPRGMGRGQGLFSAAAKEAAEEDAIADIQSVLGMSADEEDNDAPASAVLVCSKMGSGQISRVFRDRPCTLSSEPFGADMFVRCTSRLRRGVALQRDSDLQSPHDLSCTPDASLDATCKVVVNLG